ncbi:DUF1049 domain-containing protein [Candidatus Fermentibacteria bacterium]|nr:DUF1049 domain-containing protein [Candidatus Fermentibacteria bacterium]
MWFVRWLVIAIVFVALLFFGFQNSGQIVQQLWIVRTIYNVPLLLVLLASFLLGMVVMFFIASVEYFRMQAKVRGVRKERDRLTEQAQGFQRIPLQDIDDALTDNADDAGGGGMG